MSGRRAAFKVAARDARRNKKRTLFLVALVAAPVFLAVVVSGLARANTVTNEERVLAGFGTADVAVETLNATPEMFEWVADVARTADPAAETLDVRVSIWSDGSRSHGQLFDLDLTDPIAAGFRRLVAGRAPETVDEIVLTEYLADSLEVGVGDTVQFPLWVVYGDEETEMTVVGLMSHPVFWENADAVVVPEILDQVEARNPPFSGGYTEARVLVVTGREAAVANALRREWETDRFQFYPQDREWPVPDRLHFIPDSYWTVLTDDEVGELEEITNTQGVVAAQNRMNEMIDSSLELRLRFFLPTMDAMGRQERLRIESSPILQSAAVIGTAVAAVLLVEVAFLAGAAFATGTRRRLRDLGLMSSNGASDRHIRTTVLGEGLVVGGLAAVAGAVAAVTGLILARPTLQQFVERRISGFPLTPVDLAGPMILAVVACVVAAWYPAKTASEVPTLTALQGRMPVAKPKRWVPVAGVVFAGIGTLIYGVGLGAGSGRRAAAVTLMGVVLLIGGVAMLAGPIVAWVSRRAARFPISPRIVLRDAGRHRTRAAGAIAATMVIAVLPVVLLSVAHGESQRHAMLYGLPADQPQAVIRSGWDMESGERIIFTIDDYDEVQSLVGQAVEVLPGGSGIVVRAIDRVVDFPATWTFIRDDEPIPYSMVGFGDARIAIADRELLAFLDDSRLDRILEQDGMVLIGIEERHTEIGIDGVPFVIGEVPVGVQRAHFPRVLVSEETARLNGWEPTQVRGVLRTNPGGWAAFNPENNPWQPVFDLDLGVPLEADWSGPRSANLWALTSVVLTVLVVLVVVASITALSAAEADGDLEIMVAVGAKNSIRRKYLGLQSTLNTLFGALLATPLALLLLGSALSASSDQVLIGNFGVHSEAWLFVPWFQVALLVVGLPLVIGLFTAGCVRSSPLAPPRRAF